MKSQPPTTVGTTKEQQMAARKQIVLRVQPEINRAVRAAAKKQGLSINAYAEKVLGRSAGASAKQKG